MSSHKTFQEAESIYDRATKLEFAAEFSTAFPLYLEAADVFLHLSRFTTTSPAFQAQCKTNARKALDRAEKIKKASGVLGSQVGAVAFQIDPFGVDHQAYVLRKSSTINNIRYPLWTEPDFAPSNPETLYSDPNGQPAIPQSMISSTAITWKRLSANPFTSQEPHSSLTPADVDQNIIDDCSVCASVAVCVQHNQRFNLGLLSSSLLPGDQPAVDNFLPFDEFGRPVGISSGKKGIAWPALIEKAYMKLMGGYDFPGSNSSIDLRVLTGWIPEHIDLQSSSFEREKTWDKIANGFWNGHCVLTVGTDAKTKLKIGEIKLLPSHDYAVVDIRERNDERWLTLIDSRMSATYSSLHGEHENSSSDSRMLNMRWEDICATFEGMYASWNPQLFQAGPILHELWKPANLKSKVQTSVRHLRLLYQFQDSPVAQGAPFDMHKEIWVLLTRHFSHTRRDSEYISLTVCSEDEDDWRDIRLKTRDLELKAPYTTSPHVMVRTKIGEEFPTMSRSSSSRSSSHTKISGALSILASYDGPFDDVFFTLNIFCGPDIKTWWDQDAGIGDSISPRNGKFSAQVDGMLTTKNAGGNHTHPTYMLNPQWHLRIYDDANWSGKGMFASNGKPSIPSGSVGSSKMTHASGKSKAGQKSVMVLGAQGPREVPLNVTVVWSSGERIVELAQKEVVTSSGAYTYGQARAVADMAPGDYTVILSAFEPQTHLGQFTLNVDGPRPFDLEPIPQEGAGMYTRVSKGEWDKHTAVGGPSHGRYHLNPIYDVQLPSSARLSARLQLTSPATTTALNLSLFPASSETATLDHPLAYSGPYSDSLSGVCIPPCMLNAGRYWLVPSTFAAGVHTSFRLVVYCSDAGCIVSRWTS